jgi:methylenetetrahydrofolate--tRNA-(uracil-5-)-methyltransferase
MRPVRSTPAHQTDRLAELVCSNSLRSDDPFHAAGLLKREMERFGSLVISAAREAAVPAGGALAVDRNQFAARITEAVSNHPLIQLHRHEEMKIPEGEVVLATGPLTSDAMAEDLLSLLDDDSLYFYDSIAPIVDIETLDMKRLFWASRYDKGGGDDYLNAPMTQEEYLAFHQAVLDAELAPLHDFEKDLFFEGCLPIEELARRGVDTLRFGPMKPVGLRLADGSRPYAVVQLRVLALIPGFEKAEFVRLGQVHRNTFVNAPRHLDPLYRVRRSPRVRLAGQITGVEGYLESAASGLAIAIYLALQLQGIDPEPFPSTTALGALARHLTESDPKGFQPANINYGLFPELARRVPKRQRRQAFADRAREDLVLWAARQGIELTDVPEPAVERGAS